VVRRVATFYSFSRQPPTSGPIPPLSGEAFGGAFEHLGRMDQGAAPAIRQFLIGIAEALSLSEESVDVIAERLRRTRLRTGGVRVHHHAGAPVSPTSRPPSPPWSRSRSACSSAPRSTADCAPAPAASKTSPSSSRPRSASRTRADSGAGSSPVPSARSGGPKKLRKRIAHDRDHDRRGTGGCSPRAASRLSSSMRCSRRSASCSPCSSHGIARPTPHSWRRRRVRRRSLTPFRSCRSPSVNLKPSRRLCSQSRGSTEKVNSDPCRNGS